MAQKTRTEYSILNILTGIGGYILNTILGLVCRVIFTRTLNAEYLGVNGLFSNILTMLSLAELGIGSAIVFALYKPLATGDKAKIASLVKFYGKCYRIIGLIIAVVGLLLIPFMDLLITDQPNIKENLILIYCIYLFNTASTYFFSYRSSLIIAAQQNYIVNGLSYSITILQSILQMVWLITTREFLGYLFIQTIGTLIFNIVISVIAKKKFPYIVGKNILPLPKEEKKGLARNVRALVVWKLSGILVNDTDNIIITYFSGLVTVGLSSNYTLLSGTLNSFLSQIFHSITASIGNLNAIESEEKKLTMFNNINLANFWFFGWASIGIFLVSTDIVKILYGSSYVLSIDIPFAIALNFYLVGMQNAVWIFKNTMGLFRHGRYLLLVTAVINLVLSLILGKIWGLFGILIATSISKILTNIWYDPYAVFKYGLKSKISNYYKKYVYYLVILVLSGSVCYFLCHLFAFNDWINLIYKIIICVLVPNLIFLIAFNKMPEFDYFIQLFLHIKNKIVRKRINN